MDEAPNQVRDKIDHYRQLAKALTDQRVTEVIEDMIAELEGDFGKWRAPTFKMPAISTCGNSVNKAMAALQAAGYDVRVYSASLPAFDALQPTVELLITRVSFPPGSPPGVSLASVGRRKIPHLKVLFVARPENREHTEGIGEFIAAPISIGDLVDRVSEILSLK